MLRRYRATRQFIRHLSKAIPILFFWHPVSETAADVALIATITKGRRRRRVNCVRPQEERLEQMRIISGIRVARGCSNMNRTLDDSACSSKSSCHSFVVLTSQSEAHSALILPKVMTIWQIWLWCSFDPVVTLSIMARREVAEFGGK